VVQTCCTSEKEINMTAPNVMTSSNPAVLDGGVDGAVIYGDKIPAQVVGDLKVTGSITAVGAITGPVGPVTVSSYAKASLPTPTAVGEMIYVNDATGAHVTGSLAFAVFTVTGPTGPWIDVTTGTKVV
jgi:hypothetical protein